MGDEPITIMRLNKKVLAWWNYGMRCFPLTESEKEMTDHEIRELIISYLARAKVRCTTCEKDLDIKDIAGYPLFAGVTCAACWEKHKAHLEDQRRRGAVCGMCRQPFDDCCC
jgi:hypothetical protein